MLAIEARNLRKKFGAKEVVKGVDISVRTGEIFGFLGRNGAGKSTLINMLTGIIPPTSGSCSLLGVPIPNDQVKKRIGVLPDYTTLYDSMTVIEHLKYLAAVSGRKISKTAARLLLEQVGLAAHARKKAGKLSFGQKKKLGIALAIVHDPELVILDEPTSGLDAESALHMQALIQQLQKEGKTVFLTSHNLNEVEKLCHRIAIMKEGKVVTSGTLDELRRYYRTSLTVTIKHNTIHPEEQTLLLNWLNGNGSSVNMTETFTSMTLDNEEKISEIVRAFNRSKIDVLRVEVDEPTLEDIFLQL